MLFRCKVPPWYISLSLWVFSRDLFILIRATVISAKLKLPKEVSFATSSHTASSPSIPHCLLPYFASPFLHHSDSRPLAPILVVFLVYSGAFPIWLSILLTPGTSLLLCGRYGEGIYNIETAESNHLTISNEPTDELTQRINQPRKGELSSDVATTDKWSTLGLPVGTIGRCVLSSSCLSSHSSLIILPSLHFVPPFSLYRCTLLIFSLDLFSSLYPPLVPTWFILIVALQFLHFISRCDIDLRPPLANPLFFCFPFIFPAYPGASGKAAGIDLLTPNHRTIHVD